jgi:hypothetical protein
VVRRIVDQKKLQMGNERYGDATTSCLSVTVIAAADIARRDLRGWQVSDREGSA